MKELRPLMRDGRVIRKGITIRRTVEPFDHRGRRIVIALEPGDVISTREERTRKWYRAPISKVHAQIVKWNVDAQKREKKQKKVKLH